MDSPGKPKSLFARIWNFPLNRQTIPWLLALPPNLVLDFLIGKERNVEHIWPPQNYSDRSKLLYHLIDKPLARRGVFLPRHSGKVLGPSRYKTFHNEHIVIQKMLNELKIKPKDCYFVDIGAGDGIDMSNTYLLAAEGAKGIALEFNPSKFAMLGVTYRDLSDISLARQMVTPVNVCSLVDGLGAPANIDVLNLDIDSYDYFVLDELLKKYKFKILCVEINPIFPAEIDFTICYPSKEWAGDNFNSMSISMAYKVLSKHGYSIVHVEKESVFAISHEISVTSFQPISFREFNSKLGLKHHPSRTELMQAFSNEFRQYDSSRYILRPSGF